MKVTGFYWIKHTKDTPKEIGYFSEKTERWTFCGIGRSISSKDLYEIGNELVSDVRTYQTSTVKDFDTEPVNKEYKPEPLPPKKAPEIFDEDVFAKITVTKDQCKLHSTKMFKREGKFLLRSAVFSRLHFGNLKILFSNMVVIHCFFDKAQDAYVITALSDLFDEKILGHTTPEYKIIFDTTHETGPLVLAERTKN
jgi:hypothetical protein